MTYIDNIFIDKMKSVDETQLSYKDIKILKSLAKSINSAAFITENQGRLLLRLLQENKMVFNIDPADLDNPVWSQSFRPVDTSRKMYINNDTQTIVIECVYSELMRKTLRELSNSLTGITSSTDNKKHEIELTESNIVILVDTFANQFEVDDKILAYYKTIKSWILSDITHQYQINTISHANFQKHLTADLGINTPLTQNILADRSTRYQYFVDKKDPTTLTEYIAYRNKSKVWIDSNIYSLYDIFNSLIELKRLPVLLIFDLYNQKELTNQLIEISDILDKLQINDVGIYFRLSNNTHKEFNELIATKQYNAVLNKKTQVVGVETNKIPKFILKTDWKPMSTIVIDSVLRNSKTAVYTNCCDLIITYSKEQPLIESKFSWQN